ncbi:transposase family protein [Hymenobacter nivis]|uniref:transposase family protein n=1 Tax=Hymenobacter nivis TaxID=1850093 RepID=UPI0013A53D30|nr:transposase family protein [Hymenobacter nivis]
MGYHKISQFGCSNAAFFTGYFALAHGLPSHVSVRKVLQALDKKALAHAFGQCFNA